MVAQGCHHHHGMSFMQIHLSCGPLGRLPLVSSRLALASGVPLLWPMTQQSTRKFQQLVVLPSVPFVIDDALGQRLLNTTVFAAQRQHTILAVALQGQGLKQTLRVRWSVPRPHYRRTWCACGPSLLQYRSSGQTLVHSCSHMCCQSCAF